MSLRTGHMATTVAYMDAPNWPLEVTAAVAQAIKDKQQNPHRVSEMTGIPRTTLRRKLAGRGKAFDLDELAAIAEALGVSVVELTTPKEIAS